MQTINNVLLLICGLTLMFIGAGFYKLDKSAWECTKWQTTPDTATCVIYEYKGRK